MEEEILLQQQAPKNNGVCMDKHENPMLTTCSILIILDFCLYKSLTQVLSDRMQLNSISELLLMNSLDDVKHVQYLPGLCNLKLISMSTSLPLITKSAVRKIIRDHNRGNLEAINNELLSFLPAFSEGYMLRTTYKHWLLFKNKMIVLSDC